MMNVEFKPRWALSRVFVSSFSLHPSSFAFA
jgi:hypothetical protein